MKKKPPKIPIGTAEHPVKINMFMVIRALRNLYRMIKKKKRKRYVQELV